MTASIHMTALLRWLSSQRTNATDELPKTIIYSLNPSVNAAIGTVIGCFQDSKAVGKIQQGSAWWFNDHKVGMTNPDDKPC